MIESPRTLLAEHHTPSADSSAAVRISFEEDHDSVRPESKAVSIPQQAAFVSKVEEPINANKQNSSTPRKPSASEPRASSTKKEASKLAPIRDSDSDSILSKTIKAPEAPKPPQIQSLSSTAPAGFSSEVKMKAQGVADSQTFVNNASSPGETVIDWDTMDLPFNWERRQDIKTTKVYFIPFSIYFISNFLN